jgi:benzoyl-CoA reductase subunit B
VVYTFVPGNLTELLLAFDVLPVLPGDQRAAVGHAQALGRLHQRGREARALRGRLHLRQVRHRHAEVRATSARPAERCPSPTLLLLSYTGCFTFLKWFELLRRSTDCPVAMLHVPYQGDGVITEGDARLRGRPAQARGHPGAGADHRQAPTTRTAAHAARARRAPRTTWSGCSSRPSTSRRRSTPTSAASTTSGRSSPRSAAPRRRSTTTASCAPRSRRASRQARARSRPTANWAQKYRVVVEGPPNWTSFREFWQMFSDEGAVVVASTYTKVGGVYDRASATTRARPARDARRLLHGLLHQPQPADARRPMLAKYVKEYEADGFLVNSVKSCNSFSAGQLDDPARGREAHRRKARGLHRERPGRPALLLAANIKNRLESYFQMIEQKRGRRGRRDGGLAVPRRATPASSASTSARRPPRRWCSTTSGAVLGRGITNSRSNYDLACEIAKARPVTRSARFELLGRERTGERGGRRGREELASLQSELRFSRTWRT